MRRHVPLVTGEIYHVFNRSIARLPIIKKAKDYQRFLDVMDFYRFEKPRLRFSFYNRLELHQKLNFINTLYATGKEVVAIMAFALMPNHFHLVLKQLETHGIKRFTGQLQNSYAKYFNTKYDRSGGLFQEMFKAKRIETDAHLVHITRYIHLNPLTNYIIEEPKKLEVYPWTSYMDYMENRHLPLLKKELLNGFFSNKQKLKNFTLNQVDYQRTLENIKHLLLE